MRTRNRKTNLDQLRAALRGPMMLPEGHPVRRFDEATAQLNERQRHAAFQIAIAMLKRHPAFLIARAPTGSTLERAADLAIELARQRGRFVRSPGDIAIPRHGLLSLTLRSLNEGLLARWPVPAWAHNALLRPAQNRDFATVLARLGQGERVQRVFREVPLTRRAAHLLTTEVPAPLDVIPAVRFAQANAAGLNRTRAERLARTALGERLFDAAEERRLVSFFEWAARNAAIVDEVQLDPLIAWTLIRFRADPAFTFKGRTARSVTRAVARFVDILDDAGSETNEALEGALVVQEKEHVVEAAGAVWRFVPIRTAPALLREAEVMKHCIFTYRGGAMDGDSRLFSLTRERNGGARRALTIEVCGTQVSEVRGRCNRVARTVEAEVVRAWAAELGFGFDDDVELPAAQ